MSTRGWLALALSTKEAGKPEDGVLGAYQQTPFLTSTICNRVQRPKDVSATGLRTLAGGECLPVKHAQMQ